jgi:hypothetical protein
MAALAADDHPAARPWRRLIHETPQNADAKAMITVMDRQIGIIVEGLTPKP